MKYKKRHAKETEHVEGADLGGSADSLAHANPAPADSGEPKTALEAVERELLEVKPEQPASPDAADKSADQKLAEPKPEETDKKTDNIRELRTNYETVKAEKEQVENTLSAIRETVQEAGVNAQEFRGLLDYAKAVKTGNLESALQILDMQRAQLAKAMGRELPGIDLLSGHPDIAAQVQSLELPRDRALELAHAREQQAQQQAWAREQQAQQAQAQQSAALQQQAIQQIADLGENWAKTDPDYLEKEKVLLKYLPQIRGNFPADMWPRQIQMLYQTLGDARPAVPSPSALRAGGSAGSRVPRTALEAVEMQYN